ncbi:hypothetical protein SO802_027730 [Lithocarpus litseifolius]|uniref:Uncharacterized protein n=1 Tax=Lithocarpus litseifolius TaxID=425828 RepID=A0AAW2C919_9ROSI
MISFSILEAARINGVKRLFISFFLGAFEPSKVLTYLNINFANMICTFFNASSACIYPEFKQLETNVSLKESDALPAECLSCLLFMSGGREKTPAAFCRKTITSTDKLTKSNFREPVNIGSDEMVSINEMAEIVLSFENKKLPIHHIPGPEGVRGRNSDNTLIKEKLGCAATMKLKVQCVVWLCC